MQNCVVLHTCSLSLNMYYLLIQQMGYHNVLKVPDRLSKFAKVDYNVRGVDETVWISPPPLFFFFFFLQINANCETELELFSVLAYQVLWHLCLFCYNLWQVSVHTGLGCIPPD